jgi:hypothetical protein
MKILFLHKLKVNALDLFRLSNTDVLNHLHRRPSKSMGRLHTMKLL